MKTMKSLPIAFALSVAAAVPAMAQQADYCNRSGYATGVTHPDDPVPVCDHGVPVNPDQRAATQRAREANRDSQRVANQRNWERYRNEEMGNRGEWDRYRGEGNYYYGARGPEWRRGGHIPREYMSRQYYVDDWRAHHLSAPPRGYQWVQVGDDYVLVALATGIISQLLLSH
jgi:Ni/Co efflux regulator RcnB